MQPEPQYPRLQVVLKRDGAHLVTDVPLAGLDIARIGLEASVQNLGMVQLLAQAVIAAIKKDTIGGILGEPSQEAGPRACGRTQEASLTPACLSPP
jgi:hypothetical protein